MRTPELEIEHLRRVAEAMRASASWTCGELFEGDIDRCSVVKRGNPRGLGYTSGARPLTPQQVERRDREARYKPAAATIIDCRWAEAHGEINGLYPQEGVPPAAGFPARGIVRPAA